MPHAHTPGPWVAKPEYKGSKIYAVNDRHGKEVADAFGLQNARLIAAAPDLLVALQHILDSEDTTLGDGGSILGDDLRTVALNTITRATGRERGE